MEITPNKNVRRLSCLTLAAILPLTGILSFTSCAGKYSRTQNRLERRTDRLDKRSDRRDTRLERREDERDFY